MVSVSITVLVKLNWLNWRKRWLRVREAAGFETDRSKPEYVDARVLRKTGINKVISQFNVSKAASYAGHASEKTTERSYRVLLREKNRDVSAYMSEWVDRI